MFIQTLNSIRENKLFNKIKETDFNLHLNPNNILFKLKGDSVYKEGDSGDDVFLIIDGEVELQKSKNLGSEKSQIRLSGDFFGEEDYLEVMPRTSSATVLKDCKLFVLQKEELEALINENVDILNNLKRLDDPKDFSFPAPTAETVNGTGFTVADLDLIAENQEMTQQIAAEPPVIQQQGQQLTGEQLHLIMKAAELVNSNIKLDEVLEAILESAKNLTHAERGTLYLVDREKGEIWSKISDINGVVEIRLKIGEGIAGWVAENKEIVNLADVQDDPRFNKKMDSSSGFKTRNMLCFPIKNKSDEVTGVLQLLNCKYGAFTKLDEEFLSTLSVHAALALENAALVEKLLASERVTSLGKMANFLIQDIKKPILVSKRYTEHLKSKKLTPDVNQVLDMLLEQLNHVADLVQSTSSFSEGQSILKSSICRLNETLTEILQKLESNVTIRNSEIIKQLDKDVTVKLDRKEFSLCCMHILRNACDAMPDGGKIIVSTKVSPGCVQISFKDNGLGIPDSIQEKIFEPFMSHGKKEGTGLGLSITRKIIEDHGGKIELESDLGEGATFIITLPAT